MTLNDPIALRRAASGLWGLRDRGEVLEPEEFGILVEATFRLAVHPHTPPEEALVLLRRARRLDPANPKHVYHLGLLHLRHGRLDLAAEELLEAAKLAPTSHRIWAHLVIVQRRLDEERVGTAGYTRAFRRRAEQISGAIRDGADNPDPGPDGLDPSPVLGAPVARLDRAGKCRWSGVRDLDVEERMLATPSERTRDWLLTELTELARLAPRRSGGTAAFAVLGVQWLLRGYSKATLLRLAGPLRGPGPASRLLSDVLDLYDLPVEQVPARLARHQQEGTLPSFLILLLHGALLFTRPMEFPDLGAHRAARELLTAPEEPDPGHAAQCAAALITAVRRLAPAPVERVADTVAAQAGSDAEDLLLKLETDTALFKKHDIEVLELAKTLRESATSADASGLARLSGDLAVMVEMADVLKSVVTARLADWDAIGQAERGTLPPEEFQRRYQAVKRDLQNTMHGRTKKQLRMLKVAVSKVAGGGTPEPSAASLALRGAVQSLLNTTAERPSASERAQSELSGAGRALVESALTLADNAMAEVFAQARATLADLPPGGVLDLLRREVSGREAEAAYRLGHTVQARRIWSRMLAADPYDTDVLHNLAMAQTAAGDLPAAAEAWQRCLFALYALDVATGDPRGHAAKRAELHGVLAGAFGTSALTVAPQDPRPEARAVTAVLASAARVAAYERHLRLELLNRRVAGHGVRLRLGISPGAPQEVREAARKRAVAEAHTACAGLPDQIAGPVALLCARALAEVESPNGRPAAADEAEEETHTEIVKRLFQQKRWLRGVLIEDRAWCLSVYSGDVIAALARIDTLPLDASDDVTVATVQRMDSGMPPVTLIEELNQLTGFACNVALNRVLDEAGGDDPLFPERFKGTGASWVRRAVSEKYLQHLDDHWVAHPELVRDAIAIANRQGDELDEASREIIGQAVSTLASWTDRLRGASGPPVRQAHLLSVLGRHQEAYRVLDAAAEVAFAPSARGRIERIRVEVDFAAGNFAAAVPRVRRLLATDESDELKRLLASAYSRWINVAPPAPHPADIENDFASWTDSQSVRDRRLLVTRATLARLKNKRGATITAAIEKLLAADPGNRYAEFHLIADGLVKQLEELRLLERESLGSDRRRHFANRRKIVKRCRARCETYLAKPDDDADPQAAQRREVLNNVVRQLRR